MIVTDALKDLIHYYPISPLILTAGQPTREDFPALRAAGYEVVINLALPSSPGALADEAALVTAQGMMYVPIPVVWEAPTQDDLARFFAAMDAARERKVLVHCALNYRASAFVTLYRVLRLCDDRDEALRDLHAVWQPDETWSAFIASALTIWSQDLGTCCA